MKKAKTEILMEPPLPTIAPTAISPSVCPTPKKEGGALGCAARAEQGDLTGSFGLRQQRLPASAPTALFPREGVHLLTVTAQCSPPPPPAQPPPPPPPLRTTALRYKSWEERGRGRRRRDPRRGGDNIYGIYRNLNCSSLGAEICLS